MCVSAVACRFIPLQSVTPSSGSYRGQSKRGFSRLRAPCHPSLKFQPNVLEIFDMPIMTNVCGIIPAIAVPFRADYGVDEPELRRFAVWLAQRKGVVGLMTNGHTGEVFSLTTRERAEVTRITADAVKDICPVISSIVCEGIAEAMDHAHLAKGAGAAALDIMPPHHWLRFGFKPEHCLDYFNAIGDASRLPLIVHVYPAWTRASFSSELLGELA